MRVYCFRTAAKTISPRSNAHAVTDKPKPEDAPVIVLGGGMRKDSHPGESQRAYQTTLAELTLS